MTYRERLLELAACLDVTARFDQRRGFPSAAQEEREAATALRRFEALLAGLEALPSEVAVMHGRWQAVVKWFAVEALLKEATKP